MIESALINRTLEILKEQEMQVNVSLTVRKVENGWIVIGPVDRGRHECGLEHVFTKKNKAIEHAQEQVGEFLTDKFKEV